jgi:hypothetical protein
VRAIGTGLDPVVLWEVHGGAAIAIIASASNEIAQTAVDEKSFSAPVIFIIA